MVFSRGTILINSLFQWHFFDYRDLFLMLKILRPRGIRSLKFVPSSGPGAFFPGVFLTGALPPGRYEGHWSPDRVRGVLVPGKLWGIRSLSGWRGICSQSTCGGIRIRPTFRGIYSPQKAGGILFLFLYDAFFLVTKVFILLWCYFSGYQACYLSLYDAIFLV